MMGTSATTNANAAAAAAALMQNHQAAAAAAAAASAPQNLSALMTQQRLLEMSGFNLRGYDLAQHMLSQQGNVSKLLGECKSLFLLSAPVFVLF